MAACVLCPWVPAELQSLPANWHPVLVPVTALAGQGTGVDSVPMHGRIHTCKNRHAVKLRKTRETLRIG